MPINEMPAVDQSIWSGWTDNQRTLYQAYTFYLTKMSVARRKTWKTWQDFCGKIRWKPNMGPTMRAVRHAPSPHIRQFAFPNIMSENPKLDMMDVREVIADANVYRHRFKSPKFNFYPAFNDFMDHIDDTVKDIEEKIDRFSDIFIRGFVFHMSPFMFVAKTGGTVELLSSIPAWSGIGNFATTDGKTAAFLKDACSAATGELSLTALNQALTIAEEDLGVPFFSGNGQPSGNDQPLNGKYCFVTSSEFYNSLTFDPYLQANKNCDLDVVNQSFRGLLFGRITCKLEDKPLRLTGDGVFYGPELRQSSEETYQNNETVPNPLYSLLANSPWEVGFLVGAQGYDSIEVGPPPAKFTGNTPPHNFPAMRWNGQVIINKNFLVEGYDADTGEKVYDTNDEGEFLEAKATATYGLLGKNRRNIIPVLFKRKRIAA